jgi:CRP/FNR family transcriptional regulator, cyclic AMP receptor protein
MPAIPAALEGQLAALPVMQYPAGEAVLTGGSSTGKLFVLKSGAVEVVKDGIRVAEIAAPGAVFGELAVLLDQPHTADVRTLEQSEFHVADARILLAGESSIGLYVAAILAQRLDGANRALIEVKRQLAEGHSRSDIGRTVDKLGELLTSGSDASLVYAGYPYDPLAALAALHGEAATRRASAASPGGQATMAGPAAQ